MFYVHIYHNYKTVLYRIIHYSHRKNKSNLMSFTYSCRSICHTNNVLQKMAAETLKTFSIIPELPMLHFYPRVPYAHTPVRINKSSNVLQIFAAYNQQIQPGTFLLIETGFDVTFPLHLYGTIHTPIHLSIEHNLSVSNSVIEHSTNKNLRILVFNHGNMICNILPGMVIAELVIHRNISFDFCESMNRP